MQTDDGTLHKTEQVAFDKDLHRSWSNGYSKAEDDMEIQIQKEQQKVDWWISNFDPIDGDLPGLVPSKTRRIW